MNYENYDPYFPDQPVVDLYLPVWSNLPSFLSKPAFIWVEDGDLLISTLTYPQLNYSAHLVASHLLNLQLKVKDTVLILCSPGLQLVQILFGCLRAGLLSVPIFPYDPSSLTASSTNLHHLIRVLSQTKPKVAIAQKNYIANIQHYISSSSKDKKLSELLQKFRWVSVEDMEPEDVYLIQYTSGATGIPKPVLVTAGAAAHNVRTARKAYELLPSDVIVSWLPQYHDCGLMFLFLTVVAGATCVLTSPVSFLKRPRLWLELITDFNVTCTPVPSFTLPLVVRRGGPDQGTKSLSLWSLRNLIIINEPLYEAPVVEFIDEFAPFGLNHSCISPSYGLAENGTFVSTAWMSMADHKGGGNTSFQIPTFKQLLPSARLAPATSDGKNDRDQDEEDINIIIVNENTHELVDDGIEGEIWIASPSNASGYLGYPSLTYEIFHARPKGHLSKNYVRTGDRGVITGEERFLFITGRCSDVIKLCDGQEVHPHYIETAAYNSQSKVLRGGCLAAFQISNTIVLVAELQRFDKQDAQLYEMLRRTCERIREEVWNKEGAEVGVAVLVENGSVPKTTSGKVQRWLAKHKLIRGEMRTVIEVNFGATPAMLEKQGEEMDLYFSNSATTRLYLLSLL
ncbi:hypothetical protein Sjap_016927 [Stephania japonica]|uniref:AMP-dependent synthetase/ligase domain-containing protein n=1 Tax=Stephania japonica TaxID=461633 RepID=A0AAP0I577_9MAGN